VAEFAPGIDLGRAFYQEVVAPRLAERRHSAARLGPGSDVLGYDTPRSTDHDWGARVAVLVEEGEPHPLPGVPAQFRGWPTEALVVGIGTFLTGELGFDPRGGITTTDWLVTPQQALLSVTAGAVYHDGLGELEPVRHQLAWYPHEVWLWQLACQWRRIAQEEHFPGRAAEAGDQLGCRVLVARLARDLMRLCFLLERRYAPYSKWLGSAFARLDSATTVGPLLAAALAAPDWPTAQQPLVAASQQAAIRHNQLGLTMAPDPARARSTTGPTWSSMPTGSPTPAWPRWPTAPWPPCHPSAPSISSSTQPTCSASGPPSAARSAAPSTPPPPPFPLMSQPEQSRAA
jgi:Domain of unknown function (DUF4037)